MYSVITNLEIKRPENEFGTSCKKCIKKNGLKIEIIMSGKYSNGIDELVNLFKEISLKQVSVMDFSSKGYQTIFYCVYIGLQLFGYSGCFLLVLITNININLIKSK